MRNLKKFVALSLVAGMTLLAGCGSKVPENTVNSVDDLPGKTIGVQLGTTGDQLATEYEQNDGSTVERFNKGATHLLPRSNVTTKETMLFRH